jgi:hypothetical protein
MLQRDGGGDVPHGVTRIARVLDQWRAPSDRLQATVQATLARLTRLTDAARRSAPFEEVQRINARVEGMIASLSRPPAFADRPSRVWRAGEGWSTRPRTLIDALVDPTTPAEARRLIAEHLAVLTDWWWDLAFPGQRVTEPVLARRVTALLLTADDAMVDGQTARIHGKWVKDARGRRWVGRRINLPSRALFAEWFFQRLRGHLGKDVHHALPRTGSSTAPSPLELLEAKESATAERPLVVLLAERAPKLLQTLSAMQRDTLEHRDVPAADEAARLRVKVETVWQRRSRLDRRLRQAGVVR